MTKELNADLKFWPSGARQMFHTLWKMLNCLTMQVCCSFIIILYYYYYLLMQNNAMKSQQNIFDDSKQQKSLSLKAVGNCEGQ